MKKIFTSLIAFASMALLFMACPNQNTETEASLSLSETSIVISSALGGYTSRQITASLENSSAELEWYTTNKNIIAINEVDGNTATLLCGGSAGTARVGAITSDGSLEAYCTVSVSLSATPAQGVSNLALVDGSETQSGFTLSWTDPSIASAIVIDVFESEDARTAANTLAADSSSSEPEVYSTYKVGRDIQTYTISNLVTNTEGKPYYVSVYGFLNGKRSTSYKNIDVTLLKDVDAPSSVEGVELASDAGEHSLSLKWSDPSDSDYSSVVVSISPATDFTGAALDESVAVQTVSKGTKKAAFAKLSANTEYTFTFKTADVNGNVQGDENNADAGLTVSFTTAQDTTPTASVSGLGAACGRNSIKLTWTDPSDEDFKEIHVYQGDSETYTTVASGVQNLEVTGLDSLTSYTFTVKACDYNGNEASSQITDSTANPVASNVSAANSSVNLYEYTVSWSAPSAVEYDEDNNLVTYSYVLTVESSDSTYSEDITVETGVTSATVSGLSSGTYTFTVKTVPSDDTDARFTSSESILTKKVSFLFSIKNGWGGRILVPFKTASEDYVNCVIVQDDTNQTYNPSVMTYPYWIVREPLNGADGYFSLEAADEEGNASGLYLYFSSTAPSGSTDYDVDNKGWGSGSTPHAFTGTTDTIGTGTAGASFAFSSSNSCTTTATGYSSWTTIKCNSKYWFSGNSNPYLTSTEQTSNNDAAWCFKVIE